MTEIEMVPDRESLIGLVSPALVGYDPRMVEAIVDGVLAAVGDDAGASLGSRLGGFYLATTGVAPYLRPKANSLRKRARAILVTRDVLFGREPRLQYCYREEAEGDEWFSALSAEYAEWMREQGKSDATVKARLHRSSVLFSWLVERGVQDLSGLDATTLAEFVASLDRYSATTRSNILYTLRNLLLSFPGASEALGFNPAGILDGIHTPKNPTLPSVYTASEVSAVLAAIDRDDNEGKALYLAVALAATYGLRGVDIVTLTIDDIDFGRDRIVLSQHKTGRGLDLPLVEGVRLPLLDYLMNARRDCGRREVLITQRGVARPYAGPKHFSNGLRRALADAGVDPAGRKAGLHSMRHSLATSMHSTGVPVTDICDVLGHSSPQSTKTYVRSDVRTLRAASLEVL